MQNSQVSTVSSSTAAIGGAVHGGETPISGATVSLYASTSGGYGQPATLLATANSFTDANGNFSFSGKTYICPAGAQAYLTSVGGNSGAFTANPNIVLFAAIGRCESVSQSTFVIINEITTVAGAFALAPFATMNGTTINISTSATNNSGPNKDGVGTSSNAAGLSHAFKNALNLASGGGANATTSTGTGVVPTRLLNSLGNILQTCVNSIGGVAGDHSGCGNLFTYLTLTPGATPTTIGYGYAANVPTNTFQAMLNLANFPRTSTTNLYNLSTANSAFQPALTQAPPDFAMSIAYPQQQLGSVQASQTSYPHGYPLDIALDANDDIFALVGDSGSPTVMYIVGYKSDGTNIFTQAAQTTYLKLNYLATDNLGHLWTADNGTTPTATPPSALIEYSATDGSLTNVYPAAVGSAFGVAVDKQNNIWYSSTAGGITNINELVAANSYASATFTAPPQSTLGIRGIAVDQAQNIWAAGYSTSATTTALVFPNTGTASAPAYATSLVSTPLNAGTTSYGLAIDSSGVGWITAATSAAGLNAVTATGSGASLGLVVGSSLTTSGTASYRPGFDGASVAWVPDVGDERIQGYNTQYGGLKTYLNGCYIPPGFTYCSATTNSQTPPITANLEEFNYPRHAIVDSSGAIWVASSVPGLIVQIFGPGTPVWPQISAGVLATEP
jgi:streptogramin lyase